MWPQNNAYFHEGDPIHGLGTTHPLLLHSFLIRRILVRTLSGLHNPVLPPHHVDYSIIVSDCTKISDNVAPHVHSRVCTSNFLLSALLISYSHYFSSLLRHFLSSEIPFFFSADLSGPPRFLYIEPSKSKFSQLLATQFIYGFSGCRTAIPFERQLLKKQIINGFHSKAHVMAVV